MGDGLSGVLLVLVLLVTLALVVAAVWLQKKRQEHFLAWALRNRWTYKQSEPAMALISAGQPFGQGSSRRATEVLHGTFDGRPALSFTYRWMTGSGKSRTAHFAHIVGLGLPTCLPIVEVTSEGVGARLAKLVGAQDVQLESEAFNRAYRVVAPDQRTGHAILHPRLMERLLRADALGGAWRIDGTWILSWETGPSDLDRLAPRLGLLRDVVGSIPRHVWQDFGYDPSLTTIDG